MSDRIDLGAGSWDAIPRAILRDPLLTPKAKGGLVTLLSHDEGWVRSSIAILQRENKCGRAQAQAIMKELVGAGYAELVRGERGLDGRITSHYIVRAEPVAPADTSESAGSTPGTSGSPVAGIPARRDSRPSGIRAAVVDPPDVDPPDVDPQAKTLAAPRRDECWETFTAELGIVPAELSKDRRAALNGMLTSLRRSTPDLTPYEITSRAREARRRWPNIVITAEMLTRRWAELHAPDTRADWQQWEEAAP